MYEVINIDILMCNHTVTFVIARYDTYVMYNNRVLAIYNLV